MVERFLGGGSFKFFWSSILVVFEVVKVRCLKDRCFFFGGEGDLGGGSGGGVRKQKSAGLRGFYCWSFCVRFVNVFN